MSEVTVEVSLDGAQYKMDMMKLAVEDSIFVQESYAACQAVIKMPLESSKTINQLNALIELAQKQDSLAATPHWLNQTLLCHFTGEVPSAVEDVKDDERFVWIEQ